MIKLVNGDSFELIKELKSNSVKLVMTDVPYPDMVIHDDVTPIIKSEKWIEWFAPLAREINRVLQDGGSFITTINSKDDRSFYYKWVNWMCEELGLIYVYDWYWVKTRIIPGDTKRMYHPRDGKDFIAHFYKGTLKDSKKLYRIDKIKDWSRYNPNTKVPTNFIYSSSADDKDYYDAKKTTGIEHKGRYPMIIPELFLKLLTNEGDLILEPFNGSGTTSIVASKMDRKCIAFEYNKKYIDLAEKQYKMLGLKHKVVR